jgi:hypothetical protein
VLIERINQVVCQKLVDAIRNDLKFLARRRASHKKGIVVAQALARTESIRENLRGWRLNRTLE